MVCSWYDLPVLPVQLCRRRQALSLRLARLSAQPSCLLPGCWASARVFLQVAALLQVALPAPLPCCRSKVAEPRQMGAVARRRPQSQALLPAAGCCHQTALLQLRVSLAASQLEEHPLPCCQVQARMRRGLLLLTHLALVLVLALVLALAEQARCPGAQQ